MNALANDVEKSDTFPDKIDTEYKSPRNANAETGSRVLVLGLGGLGGLLWRRLDIVLRNTSQHTEGEPTEIRRRL